MPSYEQTTYSDVHRTDHNAVLSIPPTFAKGIPTALISTIVQRLKMLHQQMILPIHRSDAVVGTVDPLKWTHSRATTRRPHYEPVPHQRVLQLSKILRTELSGPPRIAIADPGL